MHSFIPPIRVYAGTIRSSLWHVTTAPNYPPPPPARRGAARTGGKGCAHGQSEVPAVPLLPHRDSELYIIEIEKRREGCEEIECNLA